VTSELSLGVAVFLAVGLLTSLPPARTTATASALRASAAADDLTMAVQIEPGRVGLNTFTLKVTAGGQPLTGAKEVLLRFTPANANLAPSEAKLQETGGGVYSTRGAYFSLPDNWQVQAVVRREGKFDAFANFNFDLGATAATSNFPWHRVTGGLVALSALLLLFAFRRLPMPANWPRAALTWTPAVAMVAVGLVVYYQSPAIQSSGPVNPIPPNADSVAIGQTLYQENCLPCHGPAGKGDGPVGLTLNPRPADLSAHAVPGVHTDGQLFDWISNGFPGSVMPAFKNSLTEDQRWNLINYLRERLAKGAP
jgi:mono/diheme cytochrome c family protein